jgi:adenylate cyclase
VTGVAMIRRLRLGSGLVMLTYVTTHLLNHALGLVVPVATMDRVLHHVYVVVTDPAVSVLLYGAFAVHYSLALWALWQRRSLRMPVADSVQLVLGFLIPFMLVEHVVENRIGDRWFGADHGYYDSLLLDIWVRMPQFGVLQFVVLVVAWVHAMIGLRFWLRLKPWYPRWQPLLYALALLVPTLALLGYVEAGREVAAAAQDPAWVTALDARHPAAQGAERLALEQLKIGLRAGFALALVAVLLARLARRHIQRARGLLRLYYPEGRTVRIVRGVSVLEASRMAGIPHASVCGGRGRCSTCRIRIEGAKEAAPPPAPAEASVLHRIGAGEDVRLACQLRPTGDLRVTPLLPATAQARDGYRRPSYLQGSEREIAILFADLRAFTTLSERKLPYDVVFLLNRYFAAMGHAVEEAGGHIDKFIGDGVMALFGLDSGAAAGCREALAGARLMAERLVQLNEALVHELPEPLRLGIGIHVGHAIVGEMGYGAAMSVTAVGDSVNTASRLEGLTKTYGVELVISEAVMRHAGVALDAPMHEIEIRGRDERLQVRVIKNARDLPLAAAVQPPGSDLLAAATATP